MRSLINLGRVFLVGGALFLAACGSDNPTGTGGSTGSGGATGSGGSDGGGMDAPADGGMGGMGGADAGSTGAGGSGGSNVHQIHLDIINRQTSGGITVTRPAPVPEDSCI
jgi:hypothetical protein